jgi:GMP synthase (glutamine-hydrolysing)
MLVYRNAGYFRPEELDTLIAQAKAAEVTWPSRILTNFTARYASA